MRLNTLPIFAITALAIAAGLVLSGCSGKKYASPHEEPDMSSPTTSGSSPGDMSGAVPGESITPSEDDQQAGTVGESAPDPLSGNAGISGDSRSSDEQPNQRKKIRRQQLPGHTGDASDTTPSDPFSSSPGMD